MLPESKSRVQWPFNLAERVDQAVLHYLSMRMTLIAAVVGALLMGWGIFSHNGYVIVQVILAGAIGYLVGFVPAVLCGLIVGTVFVISGLPHMVGLSDLIIQGLGCTYIAWLGRQHKLASRHRRAQIVGVPNVSHTVSWSFVNEVRNSLLAMRLLLFTRSEGGIPMQKLELIQGELLRLESMFSALKDTKDTTEVLPISEQQTIPFQGVSRVK